MQEVDKSVEILSDLTIYMKYARYLPQEKRRETWAEITERNKEMHIANFPELKDEIEEAYKLVHKKKVLPSMRSMQFAGKPTEKNPVRMFNCSYLPIDHPDSFSETMYLLLSGTGVGYSVQKQHVRKLPAVIGAVYPEGRKRKKRYLVGDSIEGWSDAIKVLVESYFYGKREIDFDFSDVRPKGSKLITSGGKAPGPEPLRQALVKIQGVFENAIQERGKGTYLKPIEVHDIQCHIADAVLAGGIRRAAMISLFSFDDTEMLTAKAGNWWEYAPQRGRANNSAVAVKKKIKKKDFDNFWQYVTNSGSGEPGIFFTDDRDANWGLNPSLMKGTKVWTTDGVFPIEELEGKEFFVRNLNGEISQAKCWKSGENKQLIKLSLAGGQEYFATPQHEWPIWNGEKFIKVRSDELEPEMFLKTIKTEKLTEGNEGTYKDGFLMGWQIGDGWSGIRSSNGARVNGLIVSEKDDESGIKDILLEALNEKGIFANFANRGSSSELSTQNKNWDEFLDKFGYNGKEKLPSSVWKEASEEFRKGLIDGLFSSDGSVANPEKAKRISLASSRKSLIHDVKELLGFYGIKASVNYYKNGEFDNYNLRIQENSSIQHFKKLFKFSVGHKQERLNKYETKQKTNFGEDLIEIKDVELSDVYSDVWDVSVKDKTHAFQLSGVITGNCAEISLRPNQFCVAGDTKLITKDGIENIQDVVGKEVEIWNGDKWSKVEPYQTGEADTLHRVYFSDGSYLDATDNHKFLVKNRFEKDFREVETLDLIEELKTSKHPLQIPRANIFYEGGKDQKNAYDFGFVLGDGIVRNKRYVYGNLYGDDKLLEFNTSNPQGKEISNINGTKYRWVRFDLDAEFSHSLKYERGLPKDIFSWNKESILKFIAGWADADGSQASKGIRIYGREDKIRDAQLLLNKIGIDSSVNLASKKGDWTNLGERRNDVWYLQITRTIDIPCQRLICENEDGALFKGKYQIVKSIETLDGTHNSYCLTEDENHQCVFNNVLTKQCNLTEINASNIESQEDLNERARVASFIGTLQAAYTNFHYLRDIWQETTEKEALTGVSMTGIGSGAVLNYNLKEAANIVNKENARIADKIGIRHAARTTAIKPSGTTSLALGTSSGVHGWWDPYYIRNIRVGKNEPIYSYLWFNLPDFLEDDMFNPDKISVLSIPQKAPEGAIYRHESPIETLERVKKFNTEWVRQGHRDGVNYNNVSCTINVKDKDNEWEEVGEWMWENRDYYTAIAVLPYDGGTYKQAPFQTTDEEKYNELFKKLETIDLTKVVEEEDGTDLQGELACAGGVCVVTGTNEADKEQTLNA